MVRSEEVRLSPCIFKGDQFGSLGEIRGRGEGGWLRNGGVEDVEIKFPGIRTAINAVRFRFVLSENVSSRGIVCLVLSLN